MQDEDDDAMLMALADGELTGPAADTLRRRIAADAGLAERYAVFAETAALLRGAYDAGPVPDRLIAAVLTTQPQAEVAPAEPASNVVPLRRPAPRMVWPMALAASVLLAVGAGFLAGQGMAPGAGDIAAGPQQAALALAGVATGGTAALSDGSMARVLGTFETDLGLCRMIGIDVPQGNAERVIACRDAAGWQVALAVASGRDGAFLPASDMAVGLVDGFLDEIGAGPALDAAAEAAALAR